ncbi:hypothetical protein AXA44_13900 [Rhodococcus sp. SC4]|nr:hypothetical protein AXA44_13900 [Rhodococcus sp. SC4]
MDHAQTVTLGVLSGDMVPGAGQCGADGSPSRRSARTENGASMSTIIFDQLLPYLGAEGATYWAQLLMVDPV